MKRGPGTYPAAGLAAVAVLAAAPAPAAQAGGGIDMTMTMLRTAGVLAMVIGLLLAAAWFLRRFGGRRFSGGGMGSMIRVLDTRMIGPRRYVTVLQVAGRTLALGVTEQNITLLAELSETDLAATPAAGNTAGTGFAAVLGRIAGEKGRERGRE